MLEAKSTALPKCEAIAQHARPDTCQQLFAGLASSSSSSLAVSPYLITVLVTQSAQIGNVAAGSLVLCSRKTLSIAGAVTSDFLGCASGAGPGKSAVVEGASGGAGHGGRGGNTEPGDKGAGAAYDFTPSLVIGAGATWPIWPGSGAASDDGPDAPVGGAGGGLIHANAPTLRTKRGGGGAGGAIVVFTSTLSGKGTIDASGGNSTDSAARRSAAVAATATVKGGGGGGGGIVLVTYGNGSDADVFVREGGRIIADGGNSASGERGAGGLLVAANCSQGRGGVLCAKCAAGTHSPSGTSQCVACGPGTFAKDEGAASCTKCSAGDVVGFCLRLTRVARTDNLHL